VLITQRGFTAKEWQNNFNYSSAHQKNMRKMIIKPRPHCPFTENYFAPNHFANKLARTDSRPPRPINEKPHPLPDGA
jgi:hypothetical protein